MNNQQKEAANQLLNTINNKVFQAKSLTDSLFGGELAKTFYFANLSTFDTTTKYKTAATRSFEKVMADFNNGEARFYGPYLCNGMTGLLYIIVFLIKKGIIGNYNLEDIEPLAEHLTEAALIGIENDNNDFLHGSFGTLYTLAEYAKISKNYKHLQLLLSAIETRYLKEKNPWIPCGHDPDTIGHMINFSLSHGQCGLLLTLFHVYGVIGMEARGRELLKTNIDYIISLRQVIPFENTYSFFPSIIDLKNSTSAASNRLAWCYGDLGNILLLYHAGEFFNDERYTQIATEEGLKTTERLRYEETLIKDPYLCHGTSGVAQIYRLLYEISGVPQYQQSHRYWMQETTDRIQNILTSQDNELQELNFAEGLPGLGLSLLTFLSPEWYDWSEILLIA